MEVNSHKLTTLMISLLIYTSIWEIMEHIEVKKGQQILTYYNATPWMLKHHKIVESKWKEVSLNRVENKGTLVLILIIWI